MSYWDTNCWEVWEGDHMRSDRFNSEANGGSKTRRACCCFSVTLLSHSYKLCFYLIRLVKCHQYTALILIRAHSYILGLMWLTLVCSHQPVGENYNNQDVKTDWTIQCLYRTSQLFNLIKSVQTNVIGFVWLHHVKDVDASVSIKNVLGFSFSEHAHLGGKKLGQSVCSSEQTRLFNRIWLLVFVSGMYTYRNTYRSQTYMHTM